ncbi:MAG: serine/threonine-protein kinase, partial [Rubrivivax sp.]|nr:serine/threonine-protein kinase [Rubrivivax sp.]
MFFADFDQWPRLSTLLDELLELDPAALARRLAGLREQDPALAEAAQNLLSRRTAIEREGFLLQPPRLPAELRQGQTIGAYEIEREIGQGGMGMVWLARRTDGRFDGQVAIKFLAAGLSARGGAARFMREGSLLARLSHPHIARLLDAGLAPGSEPYLVLEYVDGSTIDRYCDGEGLDITARIRLCLDVLDAVAHAHTRLILHRDIKPSNILVTTGGDVKLLDFGIAKLLDDQTGLGQATALTRESGNAFTMQYAAPEQVQGGDVTTATDVYALGVLLHLLLTGLHPGTSADTPLERMRELVEVEAAPMSLALQQARPADAKARRQARALRGDLDTIVGKALQKSPAARYANAEQLADDLRRWLADVPILARGDA